MILEYKNLNLKEVEKLNREKTIFLLAVSPLEVHGPHLPVGTDVIIAEDLLNKYIEELEKQYPEYQQVVLPPLYAGSNALPVKGSISIKAGVLEKLIYNYGKALAVQGFKYLFLADNHGGPGHQLAIEKASRKLWKRYRFYLVAPFNLVFRYMVKHDSRFLEMTGLKPGICGDDTDSHAGTNETSLMLAIKPEMVKAHDRVPPSEPPDYSGINKLIFLIAGLVKRFGGRKLGEDLVHLANLLAWTGDKEMKPYMGSPAEASVEAGRAMLDARVQIAMGLFKQALAGKRIDTEPLLWQLRFLRWFA